MQIGVIGTGYVGLVSGTCFAEFGHQVTCIDTNEAKIEGLKKGVIPIYEPGLDDLVKKQVDAKRLSFSTNIKDGVQNMDAVFIAVGTPPREEDGHADLTFVHQAARQIAQNLNQFTVIVNKSTVPVGTAREVDKIMREENPDADFGVCSNPEFLREGAAINDFMRPDRVVVGTDSERSAEVMRKLYRPLFINEVPMVVTTPESSEIIKYASNAFLATKITFINEIANLCEKTGANVQDVAKGMGLDGRIGSKFLHAGPGYGGSCFPKDTLALSQTGQKYGAPQTIVETVVKVNYQRQKDMADRIIKACGGSVEGKKIAVLGVSFKPNTDDVREAPSLIVIPALQKAGAKVTAHDPIAQEEASKHLEVDWASDPYEAAKEADALVILTEWNEYRGLHLEKLKEIMASPRLIDLRNIYKIPDVKKHGFHYVSIGRTEIFPDGKNLKVVSA